MRHSKETPPQLKHSIGTKQEDAKFYSDVLHGIKNGVIIALSLFWIPFAAIYALSRWWFVIAYGAALVVAAAIAGVLGKNHFRNASDS